MKSQFLSSFATIIATVLLATPTAPAHAVNLNTSALVCQQSIFQGSPSPIQHRIDYFEPGVVNSIDVPSAVVCSVPRSPTAAGATTVSFFVDGENFSGASTFCVMSSYDFLGNFVGSRGFTSTAATYDEFVSFPISLVGFYNYVTINCVLPPSSTGRLRGVTALQ